MVHDLQQDGPLPAQWESIQAAPTIATWRDHQSYGLDMCGLRLLTRSFQLDGLGASVRDHQRS